MYQKKKCTRKQTDKLLYSLWIGENFLTRKSKAETTKENTYNFAIIEIIKFHKNTKGK